MSKIDAWITKIPRLKNAKVSRFSYKDAAYTNDDIEGVENYDYTRDMNVPSLNKTDTEASVLDSGARTQFSSLSKNALNHFFGRVSYNLNKVIDFLSDFLDDFRVQGVETVASSVAITLDAYYSGKKLRLVNTHATDSILFTFYAGQTFQGSNTVSIPAGRVIDIELIGTTWKDSLTGDLVGSLTGNVTGDLVGNVTGDLVGNVTGDLVGNADTADKWKTARNITISDADGTNTGIAVSVDGSENETLKLPATIKASLAGNADTADAIKPLGNSITLPAVPTSVTRIIKIGTVNWNYSGTINISCSGSSISEVIKVYINGGRATDSGIRVIYGKNTTTYGVKKIIVTFDTDVYNSNRQIYAEIVNYKNDGPTTTLGIVETNRGTFTPSMTGVSSVEGTVVDSLSLDYYRGDISSYQHEFTKNIIGNLTGNADTASTADKIPFATKTGTSTGTKGQVAFDANYLYCCTATNVWKRVALTSF